MRSLCAALAIILLHSLPPVRAQQSERPVTPDAVVRLLANLENVLAGGNVDAFRAHRDAIASRRSGDAISNGHARRPWARARFCANDRGGPSARMSRSSRTC